MVSKGRNAPEHVALTQRPSRLLLQELETARSEHQQRHFAAARQGYQRILKRDPKHVPALHLLGVLEHMDGNSAVGLPLVQQALALSPSDRDIRRNLANLLNDISRCEEAEPIYRALLAERPDDPNNHSNLSALLRKLGRYEEAIAVGRKAVALAPTNAVAWLALANALNSGGQLREAVLAYEQVIHLDASFSPAHDSLCRVLLRIEQAGLLSRFRLSRTRQAYRRWMEAVPGHPTAGFMLEALEGGHVPARMPDAAVKASFDGYAADFDKHIRSLGYCAPEQIAALLARRLPAPDASLDVVDGGCGTGLAAASLRPYARHLSGVDLSTAMLERARGVGLYDELTEAELGSFLRAHPKAYDLCTFVDVLSYFGDLKAICLAAADSLKSGGLLAFTVEKARQPGSHLHPTGRYSHHATHVQTALKDAGMVNIEIGEAVIRTESQAPVMGLIVSARRAG